MKTKLKPDSVIMTGSAARMKPSLYVSGWIYDIAKLVTS